MKKKVHITIETENLAVPEIHVGEDIQKEVPETETQQTIIYDTVAVPEIHIKRKK